MLLVQLISHLYMEHPPSTRLQQYTRQNRMTEIMDMKAGDVVIFKYNQGKGNPIAFLSDKVRYLGTIPEHEGIYFRIEITVSTVLFVYFRYLTIY